MFLLLAENTDAFLPTILSRCVVFNIKPLPTDKVKDYLIENSIADDKNASVFAEYSQGSIGAAVKFAASEDFNELRKKVTGDVYKRQGQISEPHPLYGTRLYKENNTCT